MNLNSIYHKELIKLHIICDLVKALFSSTLVEDLNVLQVKVYGFSLNSIFCRTSSIFNFIITLYRRVFFYYYCIL